jgi:hypothetical protein
MRKLFMISQLVVISKRFGVKRAEPEYALGLNGTDLQAFEEPLVRTSSISRL